MRNAPSRAFTLVELLVVVGIVTILVALLMPTLKRARQQANTVVCLSNVRQLGAAYQRHLSENKGKKPRGDVESGPMYSLMKTAGSDDARVVPLCPEANEVGSRPWHCGQYDVMLGTANHAWGLGVVDPAYEPYLGWPYPQGCSYGLNRWAFAALSSTFHSGQHELETRHYEILPRTSQPERVPLFADAMMFGANPMMTDKPGKNLTAPELFETTHPARSFGMRIFCMSRHGRAVNVVFLDGHAATTPLEELWNLKWHNQWVATEVELPPK